MSDNTLHDFRMRTLSIRIGSPLGGSCAGRWDSIKRGWPDHCSVIWLDSRLGGNRWLRTGVGEAQGVCESVIGYRR